MVQLLRNAPAFQMSVMSPKQSPPESSQRAQDTVYWLIIQINIKDMDEWMLKARHVKSSA